MTAECDLKRIYEEHYENFFEEIANNPDLESECAVLFADDVEFKMYALVSHELDEEVIQRAFEALYNFDAEGLIENPLKCAREYKKVNL